MTQSILNQFLIFLFLGTPPKDLRRKRGRTEEGQGDPKPGCVCNERRLRKNQRYLQREETSRLALNRFFKSWKRNRFFNEKKNTKRNLFRRVMCLLSSNILTSFKLIR